MINNNHSALTGLSHAQILLSQLEKTRLTAPLNSFPVGKGLASLHLEDLHYVLCNEKGQSSVLSELKASPKEEHSVHLGFSCWYNYDILSVRNPSCAIICDYDPNMIALLDLIEVTIGEASTPDGFMELFWQELSSRENLDFQGLQAGEDFVHDLPSFREMMQKGGWLSTQDSFDTVKAMYAEKRVIHRELNIIDTANTFEQIGAWLKANSLEVDTLYTSNIPEWIYTTEIGKLPQMMTNLNHVISKSTKTITAQKQREGQGHATLRMQQGSHPPVKYNTRKSTISRADRKPDGESPPKRTRLNFS